MNSVIEPAFVDVLKFLQIMSDYLNQTSEAQLNRKSYQILIIYIFIFLF